MTRGELHTQHIVHWEHFRHWFVRNITPTDIDGAATTAGLVDTANTYQIQVNTRHGSQFVFFEFKHRNATYDETSGQMQSLNRFITERLQLQDLFVWVKHDAEAQGVVDIYPDNVVSWKAFQGQTNECAGKGGDESVLGGFIQSWLNPK